MEENKIPTPPNGMKKMPPPPPVPPKAPPAPPTKTKVEEEVKPATSTQAVETAEQTAEKTSIAQANGIAPQTEKVVEQPKEELKKLKKEKKKAKDDDYSDIDIVDARRSKKVDGKAMFYYVGIFASLAIMAVIIFLILK